MPASARGKGDFRHSADRCDDISNKLALASCHPADTNSGRVEGNLLYLL